MLKHTLTFATAWPIAKISVTAVVVFRCSIVTLMVICNSNHIVWCHFSCFLIKQGPELRLWFASSQSAERRRRYSGATAIFIKKHVLLLLWRHGNVRRWSHRHLSGAGTAGSRPHRTLLELPLLAVEPRDLLHRAEIRPSD